MVKSAVLSSGWSAGTLARERGERTVPRRSAAATTPDELLRQAAELAMAVAYRFLGSREEALDATQEVLLRIHRSAGRLDPARPVAPYVRRIAVNVCHDRLARRGREAREVTMAQAPSVPDGTPSVEQVVAGRRLGTSIRACVETLPPAERIAFVLRYVEGLSAADAGGLMGCSATTVRGHCHRARARLRKSLLRMHPELLEDLS